MKKCRSCGKEIIKEPDVCWYCGTALEKAKNYKFFEYFIDKMEIIYVILIAYGFAESAKNVSLDNNSWNFWPLLVISGLVLIRFFFAPARNLKTIAFATENNLINQRIVVILDIPFLIFHSFAYLLMCLAISQKSIIGFYRWFIILLVANVIWLVFITLRMYFFGKINKCFIFLIWIINNFIHLIIFYVLFTFFKAPPVSFWKLLFPSKGLTNIIISNNSYFYWYLFAAAFLNCVFDLVKAAPNYLGFQEESEFINRKGLRFFLILLILELVIWLILVNSVNKL